MKTEKAPSIQCAIKTLHAALSVLKENGGEMKGRDVISSVGQRLQFTDWEKSPLEKSGHVRWPAILHFYSIDAAKAGLLIKKRGTWYLTPEGAQAVSLSPEQLFDKVREAYKSWRIANPKLVTTEDQFEGALEEKDIEASEKEVEATLDDVQSRALDGIKAYIDLKNPYEFQDLCAALLRGMGYYTPFVAPRGRDGGIDIIAYRDPLGTVTPRIRLQVKHRDSKATGAEVHQLLGLLRNDGDVGIFISTGGFTPDANSASRNSRIHIELIDEDRFIRLWQDFYPKMNDEDKALLPLLPVYFLAPNE
jgi:restriction system protein